MAVVRAQQKSVRVAPRKLRLVADAVRGQELSRVNDILSNLNKHGAGVINEVIRQAVANAVNNLGLPEEGLKLKTLMINEGMVYRRFKAGARGQAKPRLKRTSHILVELESPAEVQQKQAAPQVSQPTKEETAEEVAVPAASSVAPKTKQDAGKRVAQKQTATKANKQGARVQRVNKKGSEA